jgi:subtilisin family serine protease
VFAAGNLGPGDGTGVSPGNYPEALSVGAVEADGTAWAGSSRGPSACGGAVFPTLAAPGVDVLTTDLLGAYLAASGTSIAAPHVAGVAALLAGEHPDATAGALEAALVAGARDLGPQGPDGASGHGLVDAAGARAWMGAGGPRENVAPLAVVDRVVCAEGRVEVDVTANDLDLDGRVIPASVELVSPPRQGRVAVEGGRMLYAPRGGARGKDRFTYRVRDDAGAWSAPASVHVRLP